MFYILDDDNNPVQAEDFEEWEKFHSSNRHIIDRDLIGSSAVSTVYLLFNPLIRNESPPIMFETMVFGGKLDGTMDRYATYGQAKAGHAAMVLRVEQEQGEG